MNRYMMIRRLRGPAFLLLTGVLALLAQAHIFGWSKSWPLYLILWGVMILAERAALAAEDDNPQWPYPGNQPVGYGTATSQSNAAAVAPEAPPVQPAEPPTNETTTAAEQEWSKSEHNNEGGQS
jgi:hypothetical protein